MTNNCNNTRKRTLAVKKEGEEEEEECQLSLRCCFFSSPLGSFLLTFCSSLFSSLVLANLECKCSVVQQNARAA